MKNPVKKSITLVLLGDSDAPLRQLRLRPLWVKLAATLAGVLLLVLLTLAGIGLVRAGEALHLASLEDENSALHGDVLFLESRVAQLEGHLREIEEFQGWTRNLANLDPLDDAALAGAVGGPANRELGLAGEALSHRLDGLLGRAHVLRQSAQEVYASLSDSRERLSRIPSIWPIVGGRITSRFGRRSDPFTGRTAFHRGIDLGARRGTPVLASAAGRVTKIRLSSSGFGNQVTLDHGNGYETTYAHCDRILVSKGQKVARGDVIATVGSTGHSTAPHLHYEVSRSGKFINPLDYVLPRDFVID